MAKLLKVKGATSQILEIFIQDSSSTTGAGLTGLVFNSGSLTCYYHRNTSSSATAVTLVTMTVGTFTSSGFKEVDATNMPGVYQLCLPDAAYATGADSVAALLKGATNMAPVALEIQLTGVDVGDGVRFGMTALPNAAAEAAGGLYTRGSGAGQINQPANGLIDVNTLRWNGTAVATPATAGIPDVNVKNVNNVSAASVTTVNANLGTTQPVNYTGTGASALVKSDMVDVAGAAVSTSSAQIGVNAVNIGGTAQTGRDIGASVLLSNGTGAGQVSLSSGTVTVGTNNDKTGYSLTTLESANAQSGTAQAGGASTITLASGASATDSLYVGCVVKIYGGTGAGQARVITAYVGSTKVATVDRAWQTNPDNTSTYAVLADVMAKVDSSLQVTAASVQGNVTGSVGSVTGAVGSVTGAVGSVTGNVGGNVTGSVGSIASGGIAAASFAAGAIDAAAIATDAIGSAELAASAANEIADALLDRSAGIETGYTPRQALRIILAALAGKLSGAATTTVAIRDVGDTKNRISATVDADGNRSAVTLDGT
jgi:hypothetical protein